MSFQNAKQTFRSLDRVINYLNNNCTSKLSAKYSTPADYYEKAFPLFSQIPSNLADLQPYADKFHSYWTGFFSSRPLFKRNI